MPGSRRGDAVISPAVRASSHQRDSAVGVGRVCGLVSTAGIGFPFPFDTPVRWGNLCAAAGL